MDPKPDVPKVQEMGISYKFPLSDAKRKKNLKEEQSSEEHEKQKSSTHGGFRVTVTEKAKDKLHNLKKQISQQRGRAIRVLYNTFPKKRDRADSQQVEEAQTIPGETYPPIYPKMRESWQAVTPEKLAEDIHRLIYRVTVRTSGITNILFSPPPKENRGSTYQAAEAVLNLVKVLARRLETPEKAAEVIANCDDMLKDVSESTELSQFNRQVFEMLGDTSKVLRVLRCVHQSIVLKPYGILRTVVVKNKMTKDVRSDDGWRIMITIAHEDLIIVKHVRREQSMDLPTKAQPDKEQNHWEYEWEVCLVFDKDMCDMTGSRLSITKLELHQGMDKELQRELKDMMQNGNLKVF